MVEPDIAVPRCLQLLAGSEVVALQHFLDAAVEPLDHSIGLGRLRRGRAVLDIESCAELFEAVRPLCGTLAQTEETIGELLASVHFPAVAACSGDATYTPSAQSCRSVPPRAMQARRSAGWPLLPWASSSPACEDGQHGRPRPECPSAPILP